VLGNVRESEPFEQLLRDSRDIRVAREFAELSPEEQTAIRLKYDDLLDWDHDQLMNTLGDLGVVKK